MNSEREYYCPTPTGIEWADLVLNLCVGCLNDCHYNCFVGDRKDKVAVKYCYARKLMKRRWEQFAEFEGIIDAETLRKLRNFEPVMYEGRLNVKYPNVSKVIFVDSMSDWHYWDSIAKGVVINDADDNPQHLFVILSKVEGAYDDLATVNLPENLVLGYTAVGAPGLMRYMINHKERNKGCKHLLNLEPFMNFYIDERVLKAFDGVIIGGMDACTSVNRQYAHDFRDDLFGDLVSKLVRLGVPFYLKENLWEYVDRGEYLEWVCFKESFWNAVRSEK